jgi:hypothetical protein
MCDFFEPTPAKGEGNGESLNRLPVLRSELILDNRGCCSIFAIEYESSDVLVRVDPHTLVAYSIQGRRLALLRGTASVVTTGEIGKWRVNLPATRRLSRPSVELPEKIFLPTRIGFCASSATTFGVAMRESYGCHPWEVSELGKAVQPSKHQLDLPPHPVPRRTKRPSEFQVRHQGWSFH